MTTPEVVNWRETPASLQLGQYPGKLMNGNGLTCRGKRQNKPVQVIDNINSPVTGFHNHLTENLHTCIV